MYRSHNWRVVKSRSTVIEKLRNEAQLVKGKCGRYHIMKAVSISIARRIGNGSQNSAVFRTSGWDENYFWKDLIEFNRLYFLSISFLRRGRKREGLKFRWKKITPTFCCRSLNQAASAALACACEERAPSTSVFCGSVQTRRLTWYREASLTNYKILASYNR